MSAVSVSVSASASGPAPTLPIATSAAWHLARRISFAPSSALVAEIGRVGTAAWIDRQLHPATIDDSACAALVRRYYPWVGRSIPDLVLATNDELYKTGPALIGATHLRQQFSRRMLFEMMVDAMGDQVYVAASGRAGGWALNYDDTVIRRYAMGRFSDLITAALTHPGLLTFLNNDVNVASNPNENLGRELLELHTVGVGHYTETDVRQSALLLTGHSVDRDTREYLFKPQNHYVGPLRIMGFSHPNSTATGGPAVLRAYATYLAHHPGTAQRIARRLAVRFVSDTPSQALLDRLAAVYLRSGTDLTAVLTALLKDPEFAASAGRKWRRPAEWIGAMYAAGRPTFAAGPQTLVGTPWTVLGRYQGLVQRAGHLARSWHVVNGYPDVASYWLNANTILASSYAAEQIAQQSDAQWKGPGWAAIFRLEAGQRIWDAVGAIVDGLTGCVWRSEDLSELARLLAGTDSVAGDDRLTAHQLQTRVRYVVARVMSSPYFLLR